MNGLTDDELNYPKEDQLYILARNKLIPMASKYANNLCGKKNKNLDWGLCFLAEMDRLARKVGLIKGGEKVSSAYKSTGI